MALPTLNLDDRTYAQLLEVLRSHLPGEEWSDNNPSDPGITLLELLTWLGEMSLYRMNRIPAAHREKFLKLLSDRPVPVTVKLTVKLTPPRAMDVTIPPGLQFATDYQTGRRFVFESYSSAVLPRAPTGGEQTGVLSLRAIRVVEGEILGVSNGRRDQVFPIAERPVVVDFAASFPDYDPNPHVRVGGTEWELRPFLLSPHSQTAGLPLEHFMVEEFENQVRFGDGDFGAIPPEGATIELVRYKALEGRDALVASGRIKHFLNPTVLIGVLMPGESLTLAGHADGQGGEGVVPAGVEESSDARTQRILESFRAPNRLVTRADFERVATADFNEFQTAFKAAQDLAPGNGLLSRVVALMNRKPPLSTDVASPGNVTLLVLPWFDVAAFEAASLAGKAALVAVPTPLRERLLAFLEPHRLITTRIHVMGVELKAVSAQIVAVIDRQRNTLEMEGAIRAALMVFLRLVSEADGRGGLGWPLGRAVRRSQLYDVLERLPGVDHVERLDLTPANVDGDVDLGPRQLPVWGSLLIQMKRD